MKPSSELGATLCRYLAYIGVTMSAWLPALAVSKVVLLIGVFGSIAISQNRRTSEGAAYGRFNRYDPEDRTQRRANAWGVPTVVVFSIALVGLVGVAFYEMIWKGSAELLRGAFTALFAVTLIPYEIYFKRRLTPTAWARNC